MSVYVLNGSFMGVIFVLTVMGGEHLACQI